MALYCRTFFKEKIVISNSWFEMTHNYRYTSKFNLTGFVIRYFALSLPDIIETQGLEEMAS